MIYELNAIRSFAHKFLFSIIFLQPMERTLCSL